MRSIVVAGVGLTLLGCSLGPIEGREIRPSPYRGTELIAYRALTRDDFQSTEAAGFTTSEEHRLAASTCARIVVRPSEISVRATRSPEGSTYVATLEDPIFFAGFDRKCSFWNDSRMRTDEDVLEHEQVHFAISEIEARRLNSRAASIAARVRTSGGDLREVRARAQAAFDEVMRAALDASLERNRKFDEDSFRGGREAQQRWARVVLAELTGMNHLARGPQVQRAAAQVAEAPESVRQSTPAAPAPSPLPVTTAAPPAAPPPSSAVPSVAFPIE